MMAEAKILSMTAGRELIMGKVECKVCGCTEVRRDTDGLHPHHIWRWLDDMQQCPDPDCASPHIKTTSVRPK